MNKKNISRIFTTFSLLSLLATSGASPAFAASVSNSSLNLDLGTGSVEFHATGHPSAIKIVGKGTAPHGKMTFTSSNVAGEASFELASLDTGIETRNHHMKEKYLEVQKFPQAKLTILQLALAGPLQENQILDQVPFSGKLSLHGVERPISGTARLEKKGNQVSVSAQFSLKIKDFGITEPAFAGISMADDVQIIVQSTAPLTPL